MPFYCCEHVTQRSILYGLQEQRRPRSAFWSDTDGTTGIPSAVLGQCVRDSQGEYHCLWSTTHCILRGIKTDCCLFPAQGADPIHAGGGGGSEVHCPPGAGAHLGHCKYSISAILAANKLEYFPINSVFFNPPCSPPLPVSGWGSMWERSSVVSSREDKEALQHQSEGQRHHCRSFSHFCKSPSHGAQHPAPAQTDWQVQMLYGRLTTICLKFLLRNCFCFQVNWCLDWFCWFLFVFSWMTAFLCRDLGRWISTSTRPCIG